MISRPGILSLRRRSSAIRCRRIASNTGLRLASVLASIFILAFFAFGSPAQDDGEQADSGISRWKLRRVLVPESKLGEVVRGRYLPLRVDRFNELLEAQRQQTDVSSQWPFESLVLRGELDAQGKLQGEGSLRLSSRTRKREWLVQPMPSLQMDGLNWRSTSSRWNRKRGQMVSRRRRSGTA